MIVCGCVVIIGGCASCLWCVVFGCDLVIRLCVLGEYVYMLFVFLGLSVLRCMVKGCEMCVCCLCVKVYSVVICCDFLWLGVF